jgi:hypothetical protein
MIHICVFFFILFYLFFYLQSVKDPAASGKHKPEVTSNESSRSTSSSDNEGNESDIEESPAKRSKKEQVHDIIKKVLDVSVAAELAPQVMACGDTWEEKAYGGATSRYYQTICFPQSHTTD